MNTMSTTIRGTLTGTMLVSGLIVAGCASAPAPMPTAAPQTPASRPTPVAAAMPAIDSVPPTLGPAPTLKLPPVARRVLPNGLTLLVVEQHELPLADFLLVVGSGNEADPTPRSPRSCSARERRRGRRPRSQTSSPSSARR